MEDRAVLGAIIYVLRAGVPWGCCQQRSLAAAAA
jgi:transposase